MLTFVRVKCNGLKVFEIQNMIIFINFIICLTVVRCDPLGRITLQPDIEDLNETRRILQGRDVGDTRPYMVYLRPATNANPSVMETDWLCGGVIVHERFIVTSAACIEDVKHFYVISGTHRWVPLPAKGEKKEEDECIKNGAKRAIWKCVPKSYIFDGNQYDNIRWMIHDIAIVKVEEDFNFERRVKGCDFIPKKIAYNNRSEELEKPGTKASTAGWGSTDRFSDMNIPTRNSPNLLEADIVIISKANCKKQWPERYHYIIDEHMICGKDGGPGAGFGTSTACLEHEVNCKELVYSDEDLEGPPKHRRFIIDPEVLVSYNVSRRSKSSSGGFCENDHGGPLVVGHGKTATVVGIITAALTRDNTNECYGPFLFTSVWRNKNAINCAIDEMDATCRRMMQETNTTLVESLFFWPEHKASKRQLKSFYTNRAEDKLLEVMRSQFRSTNASRFANGSLNVWDALPGAAGSFRLKSV